MTDKKSLNPGLAYLWRQGTQRVDVFLLGVIVVEIFIIMAIILNYGNCFQDFECVLKFTPAVIKDDRNFSWHDIVNSFNAWGLDGDSRSRFLSYFFYIVIVKTRLLLWNFFPPHPSLSILWPLTLVLAPFLLFKFLATILKEKTAIFAGLAIYLSSCGYLYNATMIFHPGKPLLNVVVIAILFWAAKTLPSEKTQLPDGDNPKMDVSRMKYILLLLLVSLLLDEMGIFCFAIVPIWRPEYFFPARWTSPNIKTCLRNIVLYAAPAVIFLLIITVMAPAITSHAFGKKLELLKFMGHEMDPKKFSIGFLIWRTVTLFSASLLPWRMIRLDAPVTNHVDIKHYWPIVFFFAAIFLIFTYLALRNKHYRVIYKKVLALLLTFLLFQTVVAGFHLRNLVLTGYYYGAVFSLLFSIFVSVIIATLINRIRFGARLARLMLCYIIAVQLLNFGLINSLWHIHSDWKGVVAFENPDLHSINASDISRITHQQLLESFRPYSFPDLPGIDPAQKRFLTKEIWGQYRNRQCSSIFLSHDLMFLQNLWVIGELCPEQYPDLFNRPPK